MAITYESLARHFVRLPDEELIEKFQSGELTDLAQDVAAAELRTRRIEVPRRKPALPEPISTAEPDIEPMAIGADLVQLASFDNLSSAILLQSRLDAEGVPAMVADAFGYLKESGLVRVLVPESYFERAALIKMRIDRGDYALDDKADLG
jgi:cell division septation protein DedD